MDKVVRQNAPGAEENAFMSEEIAAQIDPMKKMISELEFLVGSKKDKQVQPGTKNPDKQASG